MSPEPRTWLARGTYRPTTSSVRDNIILENISPAELVRYLSYDFERFALASLESFCMATAGANGSYAWPLLKLYYSAFFAAHAIMRAMGEGVAKLEREQANILETVVDLNTGRSPGIAPGMYWFRLHQGPDQQLLLSLAPQSPGAGVHDSFWRTFDAFLRRRSEEATQRSTAEAALFVAGSAELSAFLRPRRGHSTVWFSSIRNEINYQHYHKTWLPDTSAKTLGVDLTTMSLITSSSVRLDASPERQPVPMFARLSQYLSCLSWEIAEHVAASSSAFRAFGSRWRALKQKLNLP